MPFKRQIEFIWCICASSAQKCLCMLVVTESLGQPRPYLQHFDGAQVMVCQGDGTWEAGEMESPYGRGINLQILVNDIAPLIRSL